MDLIKELGPLALASRLKRLSDRLMRDVARVYEKQRVDFEPRWFAMTYLLDKEGPMNVTSVARALGMTHPAVNQIAGAMSKRGLLTGAKGKTDERQRLLSLTAKGKAMVGQLRPVWKEIDIANRDLLYDTSKDFMTVLNRIEGELNKRDMFQRVMQRIGPKQVEVRIVGYRPALKKYFRALNYEWLQKYFEVEPVDEKVLANPSGRILKQGGHVLFAEVDGQIVGTCALLRLDDHAFELAKMAVTERMQGRGVGRTLLRAAMDTARENGARTIELYTSPKLLAARSLYKSHGFREVKPDQSERGVFRRCTIRMRLELKT